MESGPWAQIYARLNRRPGKHSQLSPADLDDLAPRLARANMDRALSFFDAQVDDARLTLAVAATGLAYGGRLLTRAEPEAAMRGPGGRIHGLEVAIK